MIRNHAINVVSIEDERYLVNVGFGSNAPIQPIPLIDGKTAQGIPPSEGRLLWISIPQHTDPSSRVWMF